MWAFIGDQNLNEGNKLGITENAIQPIIKNAIRIKDSITIFLLQRAFKTKMKNTRNPNFIIINLMMSILNRILYTNFKTMNTPMRSSEKIK
jgi:hypothetical protein